MTGFPVALKGWLLCLPALAIFCCFFVGPALVGAYVSVHSWNGSSPRLNFVGLNNYLDLFSNARFWNALGVTLLAFIGLVLIKLPLAVDVPHLAPAGDPAHSRSLSLAAGVARRARWQDA